MLTSKNKRAKKLIIVTDGEPDDLWSIYMILNSKLKISVISILVTSPDPNYHFMIIDQLIKSCDFKGGVGL